MIYPELTGGASTTSSVKHHVASCKNQTWKELLLNVFPNILDFTPVVSRLYIIKYHIKTHDYLDILDTLLGNLIHWHANRHSVERDPQLGPILVSVGDPHRESTCQRWYRGGPTLVATRSRRISNRSWTIQRISCHWPWLWNCPGPTCRCHTPHHCQWPQPPKTKQNRNGEQT